MGPRTIKRIDRSLQATLQRSAVDEPVLTLLEQYRFMRGTHFHAHLPHMNLRTINLRLKRLANAGVIHKVDNDPQARRNHNNYSDLYEADPDGTKRLLKLIGLLPPETTFRRNEFEPIGDQPDRETHHTLMLCDALSNIELAHKKLGLGFVNQGTIRRGPGGDLDRDISLPYSIKHTTKGGKVETRTSHAIPDGIWLTKYADVSRLFLLETERTGKPWRDTIEQSSVYRKCLAYLDIQDKKAIRQLGRNNFNVCFMYPTVKRAENARDMVLEKIGPSDLFLFGVQKTHDVEQTTVRPNSQVMEMEWLRVGMENITLAEPQ